MKRIPFLLQKFFLLATLVLAGCNLPRVAVLPVDTETATAPAVSITPTDTVVRPANPVELGLAENPLILTMMPSATAHTRAQIDAAKVIASQITERTGYTVVTVIPDSYTALVNAIENGNAHIVLLDPYAYELAYQRDVVQAAFAVVKDGVGKYGSQFIAPREEGFKSYFNPVIEENFPSADAGTALEQLTNKKPCWSDETSASGYVIPLGYLNSNQVVTRPAAFVEGHPTVVRSLYAGGICDFGATYIDARKFPSLEDEFPDLVEQVIVLWRIPDIIPYDVLAFSTDMPQGMRELILNAIPAILQTEAGKAAFKTAYDIEELEVVNDGYYEDFRIYVKESGVELSTLVK